MCRKMQIRPTDIDPALASIVVSLCQDRLHQNVCLLEVGTLTKMFSMSYVWLSVLEKDFKVSMVQ